MFLCLFLCLLSLSWSQLIPCEESVTDFARTLNTSDIISSIFVGHHDFLFNEVTRFLGCNHTHFDVFFNGKVETYLADIFRFNDPSPEECGDNGNCYYSFCVPFHDGNQHNGTHDDASHSGKNSLEREDDHKRFLQHSHGDSAHQNSTSDTSSYYLPNHILRIGHANVCCSQLNLEVDVAHHTCELNSAFSAPCQDLNSVILQQVQEAEFVGVVHPPEHPNGFPDEGIPRILQHDDGNQNDDAGESDHGHGSETHNNGTHTEYIFLGCNRTHVDLFSERHIYTYELSDLSFQSNSCHNQSHGLQNVSTLMPITGECVRAVCLASDESEHDHGRFLQHHDDSALDLDGVDLTVNSQYYIDGYALYSTVHDQCCHEVSFHGDQELRTAGECTTDGIIGLLEVTDGETENPPTTDDGEGVKSSTSFFETTGLYIIGALVLVVIGAIAYVRFVATRERHDVKEIKAIKEDESLKV